MIRPPKPTTKNNKVNSLFDNIRIQGENCHSLHYFNGKNLKPMTCCNIHRSTPKITGARNTKIGNQRREDISINKCQGNQSLEVQQIVLETFYRLQNHNNQLLIQQPNVFKIRQLSSHSKRAKQNQQPNRNKTTQMKYHSLKEQLNKQPIQYQTDNLMSNTQQNKSDLIANKTKILPITIKQIESNFCFILSESLFEESILSESGVNKLKIICQMIQNKGVGLIVLKISRFGNVLGKIDYIKENKVKLDYVIVNGEKHVSHTNIFNISTMMEKHKVSNFISIDDNHAGETNVYVTCNTKNKYLYYFVNGQEKLIQFIKYVSIQQFKNQHDTNYSLLYPKSTQIINNTSQIYNSQLIKQLRLMKQHQIASQQSKTKCSQTKSQDNMLLNHGGSQFEQNYKNKLVQFVKLLQMQEQNKNQIADLLSYRNSVLKNYIKIHQVEEINSVMQSYRASNTTAYQIAGELIKNNGFSYRQINQFREKCKRFKN